MPSQPHEAAELREEDHALWAADHIELTTVGIDIGSATSHVMFSTLHLRRMGRKLSSRYVVVQRESVYRSPVYLTPYRDTDYIDETELHKLIEASYASAGLAPADVDTGAVILTGEAIRRHNARAVGDVVARQGGQFVCITAGHLMESRLAAYGSGAVALSREGASRVLNIDIGGGTTKFAVAERGTVVRTAALHVGGRLVAFDDQGRIVRIEPGGWRLAAGCGYDWTLGDQVDLADRQRLGRHMAAAVLAAAGPGHEAELAGLWLTEPLGDPGPVDAVTMSGGVAEYVYNREADYRGDLGQQLGAGLRERAAELPAPVVPSRAQILATVIGASQYSVQVSGSTIYVSDPRRLPLRNLRVVRPPMSWPDALDAGAVAAAIGTHLEGFELTEGHTDVALAFNWAGVPSFTRISTFAEGIRAALPRTLARGRLVCLVFDDDVARLVGTLLHERLGPASSIVAIDGVVLHDFDFIDIGRIMDPSRTVSVTIKSLLFEG